MIRNIDAQNSGIQFERVKLSFASSAAKLSTQLLSRVFGMDQSKRGLKYRNKLLLFFVRGAHRAAKTFFSSEIKRAESSRCCDVSCFPRLLGHDWKAFIVLVSHHFLYVLIIPSRVFQIQRVG